MDRRLATLSGKTGVYPEGLCRCWTLDPTWMMLRSNCLSGLRYHHAGARQGVVLIRGVSLTNMLVVAAQGSIHWYVANPSLASARFLY